MAEKARRMMLLKEAVGLDAQDRMDRLLEDAFGIHIFLCTHDFNIRH